MSKKYIVQVKNDNASTTVTVDANTKTAASVKAAQKVGGSNIKVTSINKRDGDA